MSDLPERARIAADVLTEANKRDGINAPWTPQDLRRMADRWEREDAKAASKEEAVEGLARDLAASSHWLSIPDTHMDLARKLIDAGWTKATGDE